MAKLSGSMQDALIAMSGKVMAIPPVNGRTLTALESRGLATREMVGAWQLTGDGEAEASRIRAERDQGAADEVLAAIKGAAARGRAERDSTKQANLCPSSFPAYGTCIRGTGHESLHYDAFGREWSDDDIAELAARHEAERDFAALPAIEGYRWQWFNPQGGLPESRDTIQLMYADNRTLSPAALLRKNRDGTWYAERGSAWGMNGFIFGSFERSFSMLVCVAAIVAEADERGALAAWAQLQDEARLAAGADERMLTQLRSAGQIRRWESKPDGSWGPVDSSPVATLRRRKPSVTGRRVKWRKVR